MIINTSNILNISINSLERNLKKKKPCGRKSWICNITELYAKIVTLILRKRDRGGWDRLTRGAYF
jgi:hypothetical protein